MNYQIWQQQEGHASEMLAEDTGMLISHRPQDLAHLFENLCIYRSHNSPETQR